MKNLPSAGIKRRNEDRAYAARGMNKKLKDSASGGDKRRGIYEEHAFGGDKKIRIEGNQMKSLPSAGKKRRMKIARQAREEEEDRLRHPWLRRVVVSLIEQRLQPDNSFGTKIAS